MTPPFPIPPLPEPNSSRNFPVKKYWSISKDPNYPFDELDQSNDILKKVVLDEIGKYPSLWRAKSQEAEKANYSKIAVSTFKRTGLLMSLKSIIQIYKCAKDNLRNRLRSAIARQNWNPAEIERHMWSWDYYPHIRFYRELTQPWEQSLWIERQRRLFAQGQEMKVFRPPVVENGAGVCVEYPDDNEIIWDPTPPQPPSQPPPQNRRPVEPATRTMQEVMQQAAVPPQVPMQQELQVPQQDQRLQPPTQTNKDTSNSRKRPANATAEKEKRSPPQKKPAPSSGPAPVQTRQTPPHPRNNMNEAPVQATNENPQLVRVPPQQPQQPTHYLGADGLMHRITCIRPQQPGMPPHFNQPHPHPAFGNMPHPAHAAQGLPSFNNFVPPGPNGQFNPNMPFPPFRGPPNQPFHPNDPRHPMYNPRLVALQTMGANRPTGEVLTAPNRPIQNILPGPSQPVQDPQLPLGRLDRVSQHAANCSTMNGREKTVTAMQSKNQSAAVNRQEATSTESKKSTFSPASAVAMFEHEVSQIAFQAIRIARENPDSIRVLRKVLFDSAFVFDGKTFNSAKDVYKELYDRS